MDHKGAVEYSQGESIGSETYWYGLQYVPKLGGNGAEGGQETGDQDRVYAPKVVNQARQLNSQ